MDEQWIVSRAADLMQTEIDGDLVALDITNGSCFGFNATATRVWSLIETPSTVGALADRLTEEFAVERARCVQDVSALLRMLERQGLVRLSPA